MHQLKSLERTENSLRAASPGARWLNGGMAVVDQPGTQVTSRVSRRQREVETSQHRGGAEAVAPSEAEEYRVDLERIRFSPFFARLSAVTQVVPQSGVGPVMHNRLTHSLKVSAVARVIAAHLAGSVAKHQAFERGDEPEPNPTGKLIDSLGGCDTVVAQAAAHAHDLGHPPFGHLGERVLDRVARTHLGLAEGFEGNAQSFRILTRLDTLGRDFPGLNLTAASRAATLKYPWTRGEWIGVTADERPVGERPRGVGIDPVEGAEKFSAYSLEAVEMEQALAAFPNIADGLQTVECAIMDLADDIAYAVHDLDDFARAGVLQRAAVAREFDAWIAAASALGPVARSELDPRVPGHSLELLWRGLRLKDDWIAERDAFAEAVVRVSAEIDGGLLSVAYDGGIESERAISGFTRRWIERLRSSIVVEANPHIRSGYVRLDREAWHEVAVLKFVHAHFVLERSELALPQRGMARVVEDLALGFDAWLDDPIDAARAPRRLLEWADGATEELFEVRSTRPDLLFSGAGSSDAELRRQGRARAILDYVASLSDQQAVQTHRTLTGA